MKREPLDFVVVGSGFGGAVAACRLAEAGKGVLVLERGREWKVKDYPSQSGRNWFYSNRNPQRWNGWIEVRRMDGDMTVVCGAAVGGGSLIYANVSVDAGEEAFLKNWPPEITRDGLTSYYEKVAAMMPAEVVPDNQLSVRYHLMHDAITKLDPAANFRKLPLAVNFSPDGSTDENGQKACIHCGNCDIGCAVGAKHTLDVNYLARARECYAEIRPLCQVSHLSKAGDDWVVHYRDFRTSVPTNETVLAHNVILAAGSIGSTEILMWSRDVEKTLLDLPTALGKGWSSNGDFLTIARYRNRPVEPTRGPVITAAIDYLDGKTDNARFFVEDGGIPNLADVFFKTDAQSRGFKKWLHNRGAAVSFMPWFGQAIDASNGELYIRRSWWRRRSPALKMKWDPADSFQTIEAMRTKHRELTAKTGGTTWPSLFWKLFRGLITPHPLGGCNMASSPDKGVVDHAGKVFGHTGLYVMDGSIIPYAIGRNPSKTIAAVAERAVEILLGEKAGSEPTPELGEEGAIA
ncbi:GMC oxidoreductase [Antrihabitans spumae]|uniref:Cholesterol oxidase n=1 Tax=Antrihabitans spumae TaxID=3373370 RepID=A0ABW7KGQ3_9NOCA